MILQAKARLRASKMQCNSWDEFSAFANRADGMGMDAKRRVNIIYIHEDGDTQKQVTVGEWDDKNQKGWVDTSQLRR